MIDKYGSDVVLRFFSIADTQNDTGNNNSSTTTSTGNNNNDNGNTNNAATRTSTYSNYFAQRRENIENRLKNNGTHASVNDRLAREQLREEVRLRAHNKYPNLYCIREKERTNATTNTQNK